MAQRIYVIEDDENIRSLIKIALTSYSYEVFDFETAEEALDHLQQDQPNLCVFDIMLPGMDGITAVRKIRQMPEFQFLPIMMLTAKDTELDKVIGLDGGADDYMTKPFGVLELTARVRSLLRRCEMLEDTKKEEHGKSLLFGEVQLNPNTREVWKSGEPIELTYKEYEVLLYLVKHHDKVVAREELLQKIWNYDFDVETRTLDMHIRSLRHKLQDDGETYIKTIRGVGYRFCAEIKES
jgi:two-component system alkaline phosphatase synthesis response regulator PhoP